MHISARLISLIFTLTLLSLGCDSTSSVDESSAVDAGADSSADMAEVAEPGAGLFELDEDIAATPLGLIPFPNDLYRDDTGALDLRGIPARVSDSILDRLADSVEEQTPGFATTGGHYLGFAQPIFKAALPVDSAASDDEDSSLFLVDVDPTSPEYGRRFPVNWRIYPEESTYLPANSLAIRLVEGLALKPSTTYAFGVTTAVALSNEAFSQVMSDSQPEGVLGRAWEVYGPLRRWASETGVEVAFGSVFTTQDPVGEMFVLRDYLHSLPTPEVYDLRFQGVTADVFALYTGKYRAPRFQQGPLPYLEPGSGRISFDDDGQPIIGGEEEIRFALTIPLEFEQPEDGWPVVLYGHGTGGNYRSFIPAKVALTLARAGVAVISIDQIHHAFRDPRPDGCRTAVDPDACVSLLFFNFFVPSAVRDNVRQSALDFVTLLKVAQSFDFEIPRSRNRDVGDDHLDEEQDAGLSEDDAGLGEQDAGLPEDDAGLGEQDAGLPEDDAGLGEQDAGLPEDDAGIGEQDAGLPEDDAGLGEQDAGVDEGLIDQDAGAGMQDAQPLDGGGHDSSPDQGDPDGGLTEMDAAMNMVADAGDEDLDGAVGPTQQDLVRLNGDKVVYIGHSQGGLNGPLFLAVEPNVLGAVLSAAGGQLSVTLEQKRKPLDINMFVQQVVNFDSAAPSDRWHPVFTLAQTFIESSDPVNYAHFWFDEPPEGHSAKHILMTAGLEDEYTPPDSIFALAAAGRVPIVEPVLQELELFVLEGVAPAGIPPYSNNVGGGTASAGLIQLDDFGHFAMQRSNTLRNRYRRFVESIMNNAASVY